ncbi:H+-transporting ATPase [Burkholderiales bacterium]|nr:H+-transporting ATPase [Burkholderiales bacterium]
MALEQNRKAWHTESVAAALTALGAGPQGLSTTEAAARLLRQGRNELPEASAPGLGRMVLDQFADFMILVLLAAAVVSGFVGEPVDTVAIIVIVLLNAVLGVTQEWRAERALAALCRLAAPLAQLRRDGALCELPAAELVPGDIVLLEAGKAVPADLRLLEAAELCIAEAALTGEAQAAVKSVEALPQAQMPLGDRLNMAWKGTLVVKGRGLGLVVATGLETELGHIARLLQGAEEVKTPLQKRLARFGARLAWAVLAICAVIFVAGLARGEPPVLMFLTAVSLAVAAIPEALPAVVAISLALGAGRMVKQNVLIRRLPAVETLGSITYICTDKTGTLTQNRMHAEVFWADGADERGEPWPSLLRALVLVNDALPGAEGRIIGEPTEVALLEAAQARGLDPQALTRRLPRVAEFPFDSVRKRMSTVHRLTLETVDLAGAQSNQTEPGVFSPELPPLGGFAGEGDLPSGSEAPTPSNASRASLGRQVAAEAALQTSASTARYLVCVKGAPEAVLGRCAWQLTASGRVAFDAAPTLAQAERLAARGLRVLALAQNELSALPASVDEAEAALTFLGLVGLMDPPREEAAQAVAECQASGIVPVMITGDHPATARAIAQRLGILDHGGRVVTGVELAALSDQDFAAEVKDIRVYARVDPEQKIRIVRALQAVGEFAAMTGDGVNDAPALKAADIGVAMGRGGTDVAREAAPMVLLDDNFASIVQAVREGRRIFDNIRKFIKYTMTSNSGEIWVIFLAPLLGLPIPLLPIHILWINLVTDGLPGLALAAEPGERDLMRRPPRRPQESLFARGMWQHMVWVGLTMAAVCLVLQSWALGREGAHWQTMVFTVLCLSQLGHALAIRSERESTFRLGFWSNPVLMAAVLFTLGLQLATIYLPVLNPIFKTAPLDFDELLLCLAASTLVFCAVEMEKWALRRGWLYRDR